ncbi:MULTISPECIES: hypothetical protein [unclassified Aeromicrobium]|uniref:hypothetical protein n=1 Tax=unclassified Aeromicrobium TaxID=2633570 RepID=UPI0028897E3B|nr:MULTISPECIES: hypothetical protein [unclassified Aeromicrobium]
MQRTPHAVARLARPAVPLVLAIGLAASLAPSIAALPARADALMTSPQAGLISVDGTNAGSRDASSTAAAVREAQSSGKPVEDLSQRTETLSVVANPDGTFTATEFGAPVRVLEDGKWVEVDSTLRAAGDGDLRPKASPAQVTVSGGGSREAAKVEFESGRSIALSWSEELPKPKVAGSVATYAVSPTSDLVVTASGRGVAAHLRLNEPPADDDPVFKFGLATEELSIAKASGGGLKVLDEDKDQVGSTSALVAWDARKDKAGDPLKVVPLQATLETAIEGDESGTQELTLSAPKGYLSDPTTKYPVIIDPDINAVNQLRDTFTRSGETTPAGNLPYLMVGRQAGNANASPARSFVQWENTVMAGKTITAASMNFYQYFGGSCAARSVNIHPLVAGFTESATVDSNRPAVNTDTGDSALLSESRGPTCTDGSGYVSANVLKLAQAWSKGPSGGGYENVGVQLNVPTANASDVSFERRFCSEEPSSDMTSACSSQSKVPFLKFTYSNPAPDMPAEDEVEGSFKGGLAEVSAIVSGAEGTNLRARFLLKRGGTTVYDGYTSNFVPAGSEITKSISSLPYGTYTLQAWANDGAQSSPGSAVKTFVWDGSPEKADTPASGSSRSMDGEDVFVTSTTPTWSTMAQSSGTSQVRYIIETHSSSAGTSGTLKSACTSTLVDSGASATCTPSGALNDGGSYWVRAKAVDSQNVSGAWSDWLPFTVDTSPNFASRTVTTDGSSATFEVSMTSSNTTDLRARIVVKNGSTTVYDGYTPTVAVGAPAVRQVAGLAPGSYTYQVWSDDGQRVSSVPWTGSFDVLVNPSTPPEDSCAEFATENISGEWSCIGGTVYSEGPDGEDVETSTGSDAEEFSTFQVIDSYHAKKSTTWFFGQGTNLAGSVKMTLNIGLHNHSANVWMTADATRKIRLTWKTRIRRDISKGQDYTVFNYPDVHGCSTATYQCKDTESRYGDGYNVLPYISKAKVFWEVHNTSLIVNGEKYPGSPKAQSDRATCYKGTSCKFLG